MMKTYLLVAACCMGGLILQSLFKIKKIDDTSSQSISIMQVVGIFARKEFFNLLISIVSSIGMMILIAEGVQYSLSNNHIFEGTILGRFLYSISFFIGYSANVIMLRLYGRAEKYIYTKFGIHEK